MTDARRAHWGRLIGGSAAVIVGAFVLPHVVRAPDLAENRPLAEAPPPPSRPGELTAFRKATDAYVADRFPPRAQLIGALNALRLKLGISGSSRVVVGRDGWLFSDDGSHLGPARGQPALSDAEATAWLEGMAGRTEAMRAEGRAYVLIAAPAKEAIYPGQAPAWFDLDLNRPAATLIRLALASGAGEAVYPYEPLVRQARWGLRVYERHDSHWTGLGAYHGYAALMRSLERQGLAEGPRPMDAFVQVDDLQEAAHPRDLALMLGVASFVDVDHPQLEDPAAGQALRVTFLTDKRDWTGARLIETGQAGKPVLLMTVDSFSNALLPFLYGHFSRIVVAHNQDGVWRRDLIDRFQPDIVATEMLENGLGIAMGDSPPASPEARARIAKVVAERRRYIAVARHEAFRGKRRSIEGGPGADMLKGSPEPDDIQGRPGDDTIDARAGDDLIRGGRGRDVIDGGAGHDWISGGRDDDVLRGGPGGDTFNSFVDAGTDRVLDFDASEGDRVEIAIGAAYQVRQAGPDTIIDMPGARLILRDVRLSLLPAGWIRKR